MNFLPAKEAILSQIEVFKFEGQSVRTHIDEQGNPWWSAVDVCRVLDIKNPRDAVSRLKGSVARRVKPTPSIGRQSSNYVNEPGLYQLIFRSNKPEAEKFQQWVYEEVLPSIRRTGSYSIGQKQWAQVRAEGKQTRKLETAIIKSFIDYARAQGSQSAEQYYRVFSKLVNSQLLEIEGKKPSNLRDHLNTFQLHAIATAESIISRSIVDCMNRGEHYKQAYLRAKERIQIYASLVGVTKIGSNERQCVGLIA